MRLLSLLIAAGSSICQAAMVPYVSAPSSNLANFLQAASNAGLTLTTLDFGTHPLGPVNPNFYPGITLGGTAATVSDEADPGCCAGGYTSVGEGYYTTTRHLREPTGTSAQNLIVSFDSPTRAAGLLLIDVYNPGGLGHKLLVYSGPNATGTLLAEYNAAPYSFQLFFSYFMGVISTESNIGSIEYRNPRPIGDSVY